MTFDVDTSEHKQCVTTSDRKTELVAITLKPFEACRSVLTCQSGKYIGIHRMSPPAKCISKTQTSSDKAPIDYSPGDTLQLQSNS